MEGKIRILCNSQNGPLLRQKLMFTFIQVKQKNEMLLEVVSITALQNGTFSLRTSPKLANLAIQNVIILATLTR
jgi:hypothetical protein